MGDNISNASMKTKLENCLKRNQEMSKLDHKNLQLAKIGDNSLRQKLLGYLMIQACQKPIPELPFLLLQKHLDVVAVLPIIGDNDIDANNTTRKRHGSNDF